MRKATQMPDRIFCRIEDSFDLILLTNQVELIKITNPNPTMQVT